jgi:hypothetical protein
VSSGQFPHNAAPYDNPKLPGMSKIRFFQWQYTEDFGTRRVTRYRLSAAAVRARLRDPAKTESSLEVEGTRTTGNHSLVDIELGVAR